MNRLPNTKFSLWLDASRLELYNEIPLDDEEREMIPLHLRDLEIDEVVEYHLDEPWQVEVNDDTGYLTTGLSISAWLNNYNGEFDGENITVFTVADGNDPDAEPKKELLKQGEELVVSRVLDLGTALYIVRLHIAWPAQKEKGISLEEAMANIAEKAEAWRDMNDNYEIHTLLAHGPRKAEKYKVYNPKDFPQAFFDDLNSDHQATADLQQIVVQPYFLYTVRHEHSDDYIDAAMAYGEDVSPWYSTEKDKVKETLMYVIE